MTEQTRKTIKDNAFVRVLALAIAVGAVTALVQPQGMPAPVAFGYGMSGLPVAWIGMLLAWKTSDETKRTIGYSLFVIVTVLALLGLTG